MELIENINPELLAPAGSYECFEAALAAGADAVYLAGKQFGARAYAGNFEHEELLKALDIAHINNKKIYMTVNTLFKDQELDTLYEYLAPYYDNGLDAVIVQDIGVARYIKEAFPDLPLHASTQMAITDEQGVKFAMQQGFCRVVPARELSVNEISSIICNTHCDIECFIHGAMCYSYSGKCLMSSFIGGRSGNRGRCAQPCRLPYNEQYLLSMKDMCTLEILPELIQACVASFKIEGRMKSKEYVYGVTSIYRHYIDKYLAGEEYHVSDKDLNKLLSLYTRGGNCLGYYHMHNDREMITIDKGGYTKGSDDIYDSDCTFSPADIKVNIEASFISNKPVRLKAYDVSKKYIVEGEYSIPLEAMNKPLTEESIIKQFRKSGGTGFTVDCVNVSLDDNLFMTVGTLNEIRRDILDKLRDNILVRYKRTTDTYLPNISMNTNNASIAYDKCKCNVQVCNTEQLSAAVDSDVADIITMTYQLFDRLGDLGQLEYYKNIIRCQGCDLYVSLPYIFRNNRAAECIGKIVSDKDVSGVYVSNYEGLYELKSSEYTGAVIGDIHLYAYNKCAYDTLYNYGVSCTSAPIELNIHELNDRGIKYEDIIVYGKIPMMISAQCIQKTLHHCCKNDGHTNFIKDRYNKMFVAKSLCQECYSIIYNSVPTCLFEYIDTVDTLCPRIKRIVFTNERADDVKQILTGYKNNNNPMSDNFTKGHLNRGVE